MRQRGVVQLSRSGSVGLRQPMAPGPLPMRRILWARTILVYWLKHMFSEPMIQRLMEYLQQRNFLLSWS